MIVETIAVGPLQVNCHVVACSETREAMVVDPGDEVPRILDALHNHNLKAVVIVNTHAHFDHVGGNQAICDATHAPLMIHAADAHLLKQAEKQATAYGLSTTPSPEPDRVLEEGDEIGVGKLKFRVIHTPGHSPGGICLHSEGHVFVGDTLFAGSVGRTDLPGGDFDTLIRGIKDKLWPLSEDTVVYSGHGPDTTIGRENESWPTSLAGSLIYIITVTLR